MVESEGTGSELIRQILEKPKRKPSGRRSNIDLDFEACPFCQGHLRPDAEIVYGEISWRFLFLKSRRQSSFTPPWTGK
jgi:hypothetical protein